MKKFIDIKNPTKEYNKIKIELYYKLGGYNVWHGHYETRGYYLSVTPVYSDGFLESYTLFTGAKQLIKAVERKSEKAYKTALESIDKYLPELIDYVCKQVNIEVVNNG